MSSEALGFLAIAGYIICSALIGWWCSEQKDGKFWFGMLLALVMTPIVGALFCLLPDKDIF